MVQRKIFLGLLLCILLPGCASSGSDGKLNNLKKHRQTWQEQGSTNYRFTISIECFCPQGLSPATVIVRSDTISAVLDPQTGKVLRTPNSNKPVLKQLPDYYPTIEKLFGTIEQAIKKNYDHLAVKYNSNYGFPTRIDLERSKQVSDDAIVYKISNFKLLKSSK